MRLERKMTKCDTSVEWLAHGTHALLLVPSVLTDFPDLGVGITLDWLQSTFRTGNPAENTEKAFGIQCLVRLSCLHGEVSEDSGAGGWLGRHSHGRHGC